MECKSKIQFSLFYFGIRLKCDSVIFMLSFAATKTHFSNFDRLQFSTLNAGVRTIVYLKSIWRKKP